ncbi:Cys-tRNA(Pro) deacylase [Arthrobacter sp. CAN_C5]|uniref:Cys-tRNA(Pro) deacylase n=1 Tax=Arthrobacter sp. CAN_C5 TaxID=2760706 RepID=UPI001AE738C7|nr:Cys-tRNA(Pro) deacylase [Arthrobacter sp. CAN_C5]MBP2215308.1 Cys-tRNA(Pro)/Cys-tRNA(Cys) deacylase [Arthrobacter sp. CAN_C5]
MSRTPRATPATAALDAAGIPFTVRTYVPDPRAESYGTEAAAALGVAAPRVFKTLMVDVDGTLTVAVVPVSGTLNLKALAAARGGKKAVLAAGDVAERRTGYVLGGISPLGQRQQSPVVVDASALQFDTVLVSGGRRGLEIELAPADLIRASGAAVAAISQQ